MAPSSPLPLREFGTVEPHRARLGRGNARASRAAGSTCPQPLGPMTATSMPASITEAHARRSRARVRRAADRRASPAVTSPAGSGSGIGASGGVRREQRTQPAVGARARTGSRASRRSADRAAPARGRAGSSRRSAAPAMIVASIASYAPRPRINDLDGQAERTSSRGRWTRRRARLAPAPAARSDRRCARASARAGAPTCPWLRSPRRCAAAAACSALLCELRVSLRIGRVAHSFQTASASSTSAANNANNAKHGWNRNITAHRWAARAHRRTRTGPGR